MYQNIPSELRALPQWVCAGPDKVPLNPLTGGAASVTDPRTWSTYEHAVHAGAKHIGFVLTDRDPYCIIDLDNKPDKPLTEEQWARHEKILNAFHTYTERSASGRGYHIVLRGAVAHGHKRDAVEVYSNQRYIIFTGDVVRNAPIGDGGMFLERLVSEMEPAPTVALEQHEGPLDDAALLDMATRAANGDKFAELCRGDWQGMGYPSQSEADYALLSIFAFYTRDNEQVRRLFRYSALGKREKAVRDNRYLDTALRKIRAKDPPPVDLQAIAAKAAEVVAAFLPPQGAAHGPVVEPTLDQRPPADWNALAAPAPAFAMDRTGLEPAAAPTMHPVATGGPSPPPGLVGELAAYFYRTAVRPVPHVALAAAIALFAGIVGRSYNVSGTGLNQYMVLLGKTGTGKEAANKGIETLLSHIRQRVPVCDQFSGPAAFASGQALIRVLDTRPCFVSVLGEFGLTLQQLTDPRANSAERLLKKVLLDLYAKSGWGSMLRSTVYSDSDKNTKTIHAPNVTILGESTPEAFYDGLDMTHIAEGLIPRFNVLEYTGGRPARNTDAGCAPPAHVAEGMVQALTVALSTAQNGTCAAVPCDAEAQHVLDAFDTQCDAAINKAHHTGEAQLWNRAHLKALKLAALVAVGVDLHRPVITGAVARWAVDFVKDCTAGILQRYSVGDVGQGQQKVEFELRRIVTEYVQAAYRDVSMYRINPKMHSSGVMPYDYIRRRCLRLAAFTGDRRGAMRALTDTLRDLCDAGVLVCIKEADAYKAYGKKSLLYGMGEQW